MLALSAKQVRCEEITIEQRFGELAALSVATI